MKMSSRHLPTGDEPDHCAEQRKGGSHKEQRSIVGHYRSPIWWGTAHSTAHGHCLRNALMGISLRFWRARTSGHNETDEHAEKRDSQHQQQSEE